MNIQVEKVTCENQSVIVDFTSDFGNAVACWIGEKPTAESIYQVEVDINKELEWGKDILPQRTYRAAIWMKNENVLISGYIESIDDDGYTVLRLDDCIIPFIAVGTPFQIGTFVMVSVEKIIFTPVGY